MHAFAPSMTLCLEPKLSRLRVSLFDSIPSLPLYSRALVLARTQEYCSMPPTRRVPSTGSHEVHS